MNLSQDDRQSICLLSNNCKIFGILHLPIPRDEKVPCVLFCHGYGGNKCGRLRLPVMLSEMLAQKGIASLRFDFRGCGDSEGRFSDTTIQSQLEDAIVAVNFLLDHPAIDSDRLAIFGRSLGGGIATLLAAQMPAIKALALWAPVFDTKPWQLADLDCREPIESIPQVPMLLIHACKDEVLGDYHFKKFCEHRIGAELTTIYELAHSDHEFSHTADQQDLLDKTTSWFTRML